jgi:pimeloyl-ACP methyl ester carboxylesterase
MALGRREDPVRRSEDEIRAVGPLAARYADETLARTVQGVHEAVAARAFNAVGPVGKPARAAHDTIAKGVYGTLRAGGKVVGQIASTVVAVPEDENGEPALFSDHRVGAPTLAAINGLIGDRLVEEGNPLAFEMSLRDRGRRVEATREELAAAYPDAGGRVAVFLHGLMEAEDAWKIGTGKPESDGSTYGSRLEDELGFTPVYLRYNSGMRISENARRLSWLLDDLRREWPVKITELILIGHSMGGLIARGACHEAAAHDRAWLGDAKHLISLGAPNRGSWLEKLVNTGGWALSRVPESKPFGDFLNQRSMGIRDLRFGFVRDEDWADREPDALHLRDESEPICPAPGVEYHYVTGSLRVNPRHPLNSLFGDALVSAGSGTGPRLAEGSRAGTAHHVAGVNHFRLLNDSRIYDQIRSWLERPLLTA